MAGETTVAGKPEVNAVVSRFPIKARDFRYSCTIWYNLLILATQVYERFVTKGYELKKKNVKTFLKTFKSFMPILSR